MTIDRPTADGGQVELIRFTLDDAYSSDVERKDISSSRAAPEALVQRVENDIRGQCPAETTLRSHPGDQSGVHVKGYG
jgi:hypothetical protein